MKEVAKQEVEGPGVAPGDHQQCPGCALRVDGTQENSERRLAGGSRRFDMNWRELGLAELVFSRARASTSDHDHGNQHETCHSSEDDPDAHTVYNSPRAKSFHRILSLASQQIKPRSGDQRSVSGEPVDWGRKQTVSGPIVAQWLQPATSWIAVAVWLLASTSWRSSGEAWVAALELRKVTSIRTTPSASL